MALLTVDAIMLYGKLYGWATSKAYHELPSRLVACGCGADIDQYCIFRSGRQGSTPHADRRTTLHRWIKESDQNREEYEDLKNELIRHYVSLAIQQVTE